MPRWTRLVAATLIVRNNENTIRACIDHGWAEPWFTNPLKPDWLVCKLTDAGRAALTRQ